MESGYNLIRPTRFAHLEGHTDITYNDEGSRIITCGLDGDIRIFENLDDDDCITYSVADKVHCIGFKNDSILVGTSLNLVQSYTLDEGKPDGIITRFTSYPTHINLSKDKSLIAIAGSDTTIKVHDSNNFNDLIFNGHEAPVLSVAIDPKRDFLASSSCDGTVRVWNFRTQTLVRSFSLLQKSNDFSFSNTLCRLCWSNDGQHLFVPVDLEIQVFNRANWKVEYRLNHSSIAKIVSIATVSPCGTYLACGCQDGRIIVWNLSTKACIVTEKSEKNMGITGLVWHPKGKEELAFVNISGEFGTMENFIQGSPLLSDKSADQQKLNKNSVSSSIELEAISNGPDLPPGLDELDDGEDEEISIAKIKSQLGFADDEEGTFVGLSGNENSSRPQSRMDSPVPTPVPSSVAPIAPKLPEPQKPFQPGMSPEFLSERYMLWNNTGVVRQYRSEEEQSIEVEFHDSSVHHALHLSNHFGHSMAALNNEALALAAESQEDQLSKLAVHHFSAWDGSREWQTDMMEGEDILAVGIGVGWIAVATDLRNLRVFTTGGVQRDVISLPGPIVCLSGFERNIMAVVHNGIGVNGEQSLSVMILNTSGKKHLMSTPVPLPLSPKSFLAWAGFTDEGNPVTMDSAGIIRLFNKGMGQNWTPVLNSRAHVTGKSDHYFMLGASELQGVVRCIMCKGSRYPPVLPRPHVSLLELKVPVCEPESEKSSLEEKVLRTKLLMNTIESLLSEGFDLETQQTETKRSLKESMVKLFALACRADREVRGVEVCELMPTHDMVEVGAKYAAKLHRLQLAERLNDVIQRKAEESLKIQEEMVSQTVYSSLQSRERLEDYEGVAESSSAAYETPNSETENLKTAAGEAHKTNPLLKVVTYRQNIAKESLYDGLSPSPSTRNPFKRNCSASSTTPKGIQVLDTLKISKKDESPVLKPVLKLPKNKKGGQNMFKSSSVSATEQAGKENKMVQPSEENLTIAKENSADSNLDKLSKSNSESKPVKKKVSALRLWLDDNVETVKEKFPDATEGELFVKAATLFKDVEDSVKQKYKAMAAKLCQTAPQKSNALSSLQGTDDSDSSSVEEKKRKSQDVGAQPSEKKPKLNASAKLANFAFSKKPE